MKVALAARNVQKLDAVVKACGAQAFAADASVAESVAKLFDQLTSVFRRRAGKENATCFHWLSDHVGRADLVVVAERSLAASYRLRSGDADVFMVLDCTCLLVSHLDPVEVRVVAPKSLLSLSFAGHTRLRSRGSKSHSSA